MVPDCVLKRMSAATAHLLPGLTLLLLPMTVEAEVIVSGAKNLNVDVSQVHGRIAMDLQGGIWTIAESGGQADLLVDARYRLTQPRWSPDGHRLLYRSESPAGSGLWVLQVASRESEVVIPAEPGLGGGAWHPDGERVVFSASRGRSGQDIWEVDLPTGLQWRLTSDPGDETEPAWSANGRHLAFIAFRNGRYDLMLRRFGMPAQSLVASDLPLSSPSWRPDGSLLMYQRHGDDGSSLEMVILSEPVLVRTIEDSEQLARAPVTWRDRMRMLYGAGNQVRSRGFEDRRSTPVHFRAILPKPQPEVQPAIVPRQLDIVDAPDNRLVIRAARMYDGIGNYYRENVDIVVEAGRIASIAGPGPHEDATIVDLGNVTVIPGMIDALASFENSISAGSMLLAYGVTTIVSEDDELSFDPRAWEGEDSPGPRYLAAATPDSPALPPSVLSGLADEGTPGVASLYQSRQARAFGQTASGNGRFARPRRAASSLAGIAAASKENRMPAGLGLHAELRALAATGLSGAQVLQASGKNAARLLGIENQAGVILPGAAADLVLINGDPLDDIAQAINVIAVVRNGRFFSLVSLLEQASRHPGVE